MKRKRLIFQTYLYLVWLRDGYGYFLESRVYRCEINHVNFYRQVVGIIQDAGLQPGRRGVGGLFGGEPVPC